MSTIEAATGSDTWVEDAHPNKPRGAGNTISLQSTHRFGYLHIPVTDIRGRTVLSATLTGHVRSGFVAQTVTVKAVTASWAAGRTTWNNRPGTTGSVATALGALSDGDAASLDVTALLQAVASGATWRGVRLSTSAGSATASEWYAFDAKKPSWTLTVELSDVTEQPADLRPNGGGVGSPAPVLAWAATVLGGTPSLQGAFKVQVDPAADEITPDFDSGWVTSSVPEYDLSASTFTPLAAHAATQWRVMTRSPEGAESDWSDWASFSYEPDPVLVMDSPTGGTIGDPTFDIIAHLTGETLTQWRAWVLDPTGAELWDSHLQDGPIEITVPKRDPETNRRVVRGDDVPLTVRVRAWGDVERTVAIGHTAYVQVDTAVVFDDDLGVVAPADFTVTPVNPGDPRQVYAWTRSEAADSYQLIDTDTNAVVELIAADEVDVDAGTYTWTDDGLVPPRDPHTYVVRAVESGVRSVPSNAVTFTSEPVGVWLIPPTDMDLAPIQLAGTASIDNITRLDRRATYKLVNSGEDLDVVYGQEGLSGSFQGAIFRGQGAGQSATSARRRLRVLAEDIAARPRLVFANESIPVIVRDLTVVAASDYTDGTQLHNVSFGFTQVGD